MPIAMPSNRKKPGASSAADRIELLYRIGRLIDPSKDSKAVLGAILREVVRALRATSGSVSLIDHERGALAIEVGVRLGREARKSVVLAIGEGVTGQVAKTGQALRVNDVRRFAHYVPVRQDVLSEMAAPLLVDGEPIGVLNVDADRLDAFDQEAMDLLLAASEEAARVIQISRLHERISEQNRKLETLYRVGQTIATVPTLNDVLNRVVAEVRTLMDAKVSSILLLDDAREHLSIQATSGAAAEYANRPAMKIRETLVGETALSGRTLEIRDVRKEKRFYAHDMARREGLCSLLSVPIHHLDRPIGVLNIYTGSPKEFDESERGLLAALAGQAAVAIVNARRLERLQQAEEQVRQSEKLTLLGSLAAEIAHEIRNPLTIIQMLVESIGEEFHARDPRAKDIEVIKSNLGQINRIVEQTLNVSRVRDPKIEPFDIHDAIEDALFLTDRRRGSLAIDLRRRFAPALPPVLGDRNEIEQALLNLVLNACQAMPEGGRLTVSTQLKKIRRAPRVAVRIADTGRGIAPEHRERIFSPFFTTRGDGVGMGLFVARKVLLAHRGELTVRSQLGKGATFEAMLPVAVGARSDA